MTILPLKIILVLLLILPLAQAQGCFLYPDSPYFCKDISDAQAKEECNLQGCNLNLYFKQQSCATLPKEISCAKVLCKSTCTTIPAKDCTAGPVPAGEEKVWCDPGCCKYTSLNDTICTGSINRNACVQTAKSGEATTYEYQPTPTSCVLECNRGLTNTIKGTINQSTSIIPTKTTPTPSSENNSFSTIYLSILIFMVLAIGLVIIKVMQAKNNQTKQKKSIVQSIKDEIEDDLPTPPKRTSPPSQLVIVPIPKTHRESKKAHELNKIHTFENFKSTPPETNKSIFSKLTTIVQTKKTAIEKLQDLQTPHSTHSPTQKSAFNKEKTTPQQTKEPKKNTLEDLRKIAAKKKE